MRSLRHPNVRWPIPNFVPNYISIVMPKLERESKFDSKSELMFLYFRVRNYCTNVYFETEFQILKLMQQS
jgi:hypothetical protein